ncbi:MAG: ParB/RepB/Spo0J family partition protein [bacterium]|nr:ParB/RepB/Spo0J family partition protein [bacterium]
MSLGRGLESLIPVGGNNQPPVQKDPAPVSLSASFVPPAAPVRPVLPKEDFSEVDFDINSKSGKGESVFQLEVDKIKSNPYQPRHNFDDEALRELAQSIREFGVIQPLIVAKIEKESEKGTEVEYQLIAGERRLMASKMIGLTRVPAIVRKGSLPKNNLEIALIENIQRRDLNPLEEAKAYARLQDEFNLTQREVANRVGKSREVVANTLRLLNLPANIQEALIVGKLSESQARTLLTITDPRRQAEAFNNFIEQKASVRQVQEKARQDKSAASRETYWEDRLEEKFSAPAKIIKNGTAGRISLAFHSEEEWANLIRRLLGDVE